MKMNDDDCGDDGHDPADPSEWVVFEHEEADDEDFNNKYFVWRIDWLFARGFPKDSRRSFVVHDTENVMQQVGVPREMRKTTCPWLEWAMLWPINLVRWL